MTPAGARAAALPALLAALAVALFLLDPATSGLFPPCLFRSATGLLCPGCGATRAAHALLHGDLAAALRLNALAVVGLPAAATVGAWGALRARSGRPLRIPPLVLLLVAAAVLAFTVARNLLGVRLG